MGTYLTVTEIKTRMTEELISAFLDLTGAALDTEIEDIITRQEGVVNGYVGARYDVPLTGSGGLEMGEEWTFRLAQYDIHARGAGDDVQEKVKLQYEDAMRQLRDVSKGNMIIPGETYPGGSVMGLYIESNDVIYDWGGDAEGSF